MKLIKRGMKELSKCRKLQRECLKLRIPAPPVMSFEIQNHDTIYSSKSNSYVENAYIFLAYTVGLSRSDSVADKYDLLYTNTAKEKLNYIVSPQQDGTLFRGMRIVLNIGSGTTDDRISDYDLENKYVSQFTISEAIRIVKRNGNLITVDITFSVYNNTLTDLPFSEMGIYTKVVAGNATNPGSGAYLIIRDVFPQIIIKSKGSTRVTYKTEILLPNN